MYTLEDLVRDLLDYYEKYKRRILNKDDIVIWIYHRNNKEVSLSTIMRKLRKLRRHGLIRIIQGKEALLEGTKYRFNKRSKVVIYPVQLKVFLKKDQRQLSMVV